MEGELERQALQLGENGFTGFGQMVTEFRIAVEPAPQLYDIVEKVLGI